MANEQVKDIEVKDVVEQLMRQNPYPNERAADLIERLSARVAELTRERDTANYAATRWKHVADNKYGIDDLAVYQEKVEAAEARVGKLQGRLERCRDAALLGPLDLAAKYGPDANPDAMLQDEAELAALEEH